MPFATLKEPFPYSDIFNYSVLMVVELQNKLHHQHSCHLQYCSDCVRVVVKVFLAPTTLIVIVRSLKTLLLCCINADLLKPFLLPTPLVVLSTSIVESSKVENNIYVICKKN